MPLSGGRRGRLCSAGGRGCPGHRAAGVGPAWQGREGGLCYMRSSDFERCRGSSGVRAPGLALRSWCSSPVKGRMGAAGQARPPQARVLRLKEGFLGSRCQLWSQWRTGCRLRVRRGDRRGEVVSGARDKEGAPRKGRGQTVCGWCFLAGWLEMRFEEGPMGRSGTEFGEGHLDGEPPGGRTPFRTDALDQAHQKHTALLTAQSAGHTPGPGVREGRPSS